MSVFETLSKINVNDKVEKKNGLSYLPWAWAWSVAKQNYPAATYKVYENQDGLNYHHDGMTGWVKTGVTIENMEMIEYLPIMDYRNQSIKVDKITSFHVNSSIQRSLTKALARHGLGLYIYAGEDLPQDTKAEPKPKAEPKAKAEPKTEPEEHDEGWATTIVEGLKIPLALPDTVKELNGIFKSNKAYIDVLEEKHPAKYEEVLGLFKTKKEEIENV